MEKLDDVTIKLILRGAIGWRKLFEKTQDCIREVLKYGADDIPDEVYLRCLKLINIHELPKKYEKE